MTQAQHQASIIQQFTRQAGPFAAMPEHSEESAFRLMLESTGVTSSDTVLDVACGPGLVACAFAVRAAWVTGIDITPAMIDKARQLQEDKGITNVEWNNADVLPLPYADESFSTVITRYSFHHFLDPFRVFMEMHRVCKRNGVLMVVDVAIPSEKRAAYDHLEKLRDPSHTSACTPEELLGMAERLKLARVTTHWYRLAMELERQLAASFPRPGDDETIRALLRNDIGQDHLGMGAHWVGAEIHFAYPTLILVGRKGGRYGRWR